jgi:hypothetical protein
MAASQSSGAAERPRYASETRTAEPNGSRALPPRGGTNTRENGQKENEAKQLIIDIQKLAAEGLQSQEVDDPIGATLASIVAKATRLEKVVQGVPGAGPRRLQENRILEKLDAIEKTLATRQGMPLAQASADKRAKTWSQIAARAAAPATVELRIKEMEGTEEEDSVQRLERIKAVIPEAKAIIPHPRNKNKVSVVVANDHARERVLRDGPNTDTMKIIRKPVLVLILGVNKHEEVQNNKCPANDIWIQKAMEQNKGIKIQRVGWLYSHKVLKERIENDSIKKGSLVISVENTAMQHKLIREGIFIGAEWHPAEMWDVSLMDGQCFKCWKWGHKQSVCNALEERCGHCAGDHRSEECTTKEDKQMSCTSCKQKGQSPQDSRPHHNQQLMKDTM